MVRPRGLVVGSVMSTLGAYRHSFQDSLRFWTSSATRSRSESSRPAICEKRSRLNKAIAARCFAMPRLSNWSKRLARLVAASASNWASLGNPCSRADCRRPRTPAEILRSRMRCLRRAGCLRRWHSHLVRCRAEAVRARALTVDRHLGRTCVGSRGDRPLNHIVFASRYCNRSCAASSTALCRHSDAR